MEEQRDDSQRAEWRAGDEPGGAGPDYSASEVSRRVSSILDAVEREGAALRQQAKEEARRYVEYSKRRADGLVAERQRRISELSDELISRTERVLANLEAAEPARAAFHDLVRALGETAERLARESGDLSDFVAPAFSATQSPPPPPAPMIEPTPPRQAAQAPPPSPSSPPAPPPPHLNGAQMVAIQMAAAGSTRGQVEAHVRDALGLKNPSPLLDEVFGRGSLDDARVPWAAPAAE